MQTLARELQALGFKLNHKKCVWELVHAIEFLGFLVNSKTMRIYLPEGKIQKVTKECRHTCNQQEISDSLTPGPFDRAAVIDRTSGQCGTPPLSRSSEVAPKSSAEFPKKLR